MYVLKSEYLAEMTAFARLLWFRGYPDLRETFLAEDGKCFPQEYSLKRGLPSCLFSRKTTIRATVLINAIPREVKKWKDQRFSWEN